MKKIFSGAYKKIAAIASAAALIVVIIFSIGLRKILALIELSDTMRNEIWAAVSFFGVIIILIVLFTGLLVAGEVIRLAEERKGRNQKDDGDSSKPR